VDGVTGENVSYTFDSLNRLIAAASTGVQWSESYSYDGFGNMTSKTSTKGTPANPQVDPTTNRARLINDYGFDANGSWLGVPGPLNNLVNTWNVENQLVSNGLPDSGGNTPTYTYDPAGKRVLQYSVNASYGPWGTLYFYSITGKRLATYGFNYVTGTPATLTMSLYFGGWLLAPLDRLGSVRSNANGSIAYFPWGEEEKQSNGSITPDGTDKYATYFRDGTTNGAGQDYASARYYNNSFGRFWSPDPGKGTDPGDPISWNKYAYVGGDPINRNDRGGTCWATVSVVGVTTSEWYNCSMLDYVGSGSEMGDGMLGTGSMNSGTGALLAQGPSLVQLANQLNQIQRAQAVIAIDNIGKGCEKAFEALGFTATDLSVIASGIDFYSTYFEGNLTVNSITGNGNNSTLTQYLGDARATTIGNDVILGPQYFNQIAWGSTLAASQNITLIHEALHVGTDQDDAGLFTAFNLSSWQAEYAADNNGQVLSASQTISYWLSKDCSH